MAIIPIDDLINDKKQSDISLVKNVRKIIPIDDLIGPTDSIQQNIKSGMSPLEATGSYIKKHPFKSILQGIPETLTGKTLKDRLTENSSNVEMTDLQKKEYKDKWKVEPGDFEQKGVKDRFKIVGGTLIDTVTSPAGAVSAGIGKGLQLLGKVPAVAKAVKYIGEGTKQTLKKPIKFVEDAFVGGEKARLAGEEAKFALRQSTADEARRIAKTTGMKIDIQKKGQDALLRSYDELEDTMKKMIIKESDKEALALQKDLPRLFSKKSKEYGDAQDKIIKSLPEESRNISSDRIIKTMEDSLEQFGILRKEPSGQLIISRVPATDTEKQIFNLYESQKKFSTINLEDLIKTQKFIEPRFGKYWTPDDKLRSDVASKLSDIVTESVPALKKLRAENAPFFEWKKSAIDKLKPFSNKYDVETGIISKLSSGKLDPSEQRLIADLNRILGKKVGGKVPSLQKGISSIPSKKEQIENTTSEIIKKMREDAAKEIFRLRSKKDLTSHNIDLAVNKLVNKYRIRKYGLTAAGALSAGGLAKNTLDAFFKKEMYSGVGN